MLVANETRVYTRTKYTKEFKDFCIRESLTSGEPVKKLADQLGVKFQTLRKWKWEYKKKMQEQKDEITVLPAPPKNPVTAEKLATLIEENRYLKALLKLYM